MEFTANRTNLMRIVARCQSVADKKSTIPALANVLIQVDAKGATLSSTDLNISVSGRLDADVEQKGSVAIGARDLFERLKMMPGETVTLVSKDGANAILKAKGSSRRYTLHAMPGEEFPAVAQPEDGSESLVLPVATLSALVNRTYFSISTDDTRLHLASALLEIEKDCVRMVSTDGHRLSKMELPAPMYTKPSTMLIPLKAILELKRLCDEVSADKGGAKEIAIIHSGPNVFFSVPWVRVGAKLVDAMFPPYQQVIPKSHERTVVAPRNEVADAIRAVSVAASVVTGGIKLSLVKGKILFSSMSPDGGEGADEVAIDYDGTDVELGINSRYVLDALGALDCEKVEFGISDVLDPISIREQGKKEFVGVVMPMRV